MKEGLGDLKHAPNDGCYINGLFLEGCRWNSDEMCLIESRPKELHTQMPIIWLIPEANRRKVNDGIYECPVYKTLKRSGKKIAILIVGYEISGIQGLVICFNFPQVLYRQRVYRRTTCSRWKFQAESHKVIGSNEVWRCFVPLTIDRFCEDLFLTILLFVLS